MNEAGPIIYYILLGAIAVVHLNLEYRIFIKREEDIFRKYRDDAMPPMRAAKWAYLCKAVWLVVLIFLQVFGIEFATALIISFTVYALLIQILLPFKMYNLLNLVLALACVAWLILRSWN